MIRGQLRLLRDFFRDEEFAHHLLVTGAAFAVLMVLSYAAGLLFPQLAAGLMEFFTQRIAELDVVDESGSFRALPLFGNNLQAMLFCVLYGLIPFLYLPALSLGVNAILLGLMAAYYTNSGISLLIYLAGILPHGIFELPALVISLSCGIYLCACINRYIRKNTKGLMIPVLKNILRTIVLAVIPLLAVSAVVEAYVTPAVMKLFL